MSLSLVCNDDDEEIITSDNVGANVRAARVCGSGKITSEKFPGLDSKSDIEASHPRKRSLMSSEQKAVSTGRVLSTAPLTPFEIEGLEAIVDWLEDLPSGKRNVPKDIPDPDGLLRAVRVLLNRHRMDSPVQAVTGLPILQWPPRKPLKQRRSKSTNVGGGNRKTAGKSQSSTGGAKTAGAGTKAGSKARRRRVRCNKCEPCTRENCRECIYCLDLKKYGGAQKLKKPCVSRVCLAPMLSKEAVCEICDGGDAEHDWPPEDTDDWSTWLMECRVCHDITHPQCLRQKCTDSKHSGVVDEDFPSSWDCIRCCEDGLQGQCRQRQSIGRAFRDRQSIGSAECDDSVMSSGKPDAVSSPSGSSLRHGAAETEECSVKLERVAVVTADNITSVDVKPVVERSSTDVFARMRAFGIKKPKLHLVRVQHGSGSTEPPKDSRGKTSLGKKPSTTTKSASPPKKKPSDGNMSSSHDVVNYESLDFLQMPRVNSRGREISLPRRYLL